MLKYITLIIASLALILNIISLVIFINKDFNMENVINKKTHGAEKEQIQA